MAGQYFGDNEVKADVLSSPTGADSLSIGSRKLTNVVDPTGAQNAATKNYVDTAIAGVPAGYSDEQAQDAVGNILTDNESIDFTYNDAGNTISARSTGMSRVIAQTAHGLSVGQAIRYNGTAFVKSQADSAGNAEVEGIVASVVDANNFIYALPGSYVTGLSGLTAGTTYFLDPTTSGAVTATEPSTNGQVSKPILRALSATTVQFINYRGFLVTQSAVSQKRVTVIADAATITPNVDTTDIATFTLGGNRTIAAPTGTPADGQQLMMRIKQDATGTRIPTFNAIYRFSNATATTLTTTPSKTDYIGFQYNAADTKWDALAERLNF